MHVQVSLTVAPGGYPGAHHLGAASFLYQECLSSNLTAEPAFTLSLFCWELAVIKLVSLKKTGRCGNIKCQSCMSFCGVTASPLVQWSVLFFRPLFESYRHDFTVHHSGAFGIEGVFLLSPEVHLLESSFFLPLLQSEDRATAHT